MLQKGLESLHIESISMLDCLTLMADLLKTWIICLSHSIIVEAKQVLDDGNNFAWRQKPSRDFTASQVQSKEFLSQKVRADKAYRFLKDVRGYYKRTFYELLAMIRHEMARHDSDNC